MVIRKEIIPIKKNTFPGYKRYVTFGAVIHNGGLPGVPARNYIIYLTSDTYAAYASYHAMMDFDATIYQLIPWDYRAFCSGSHNYTKLGKTLFRSNASAYTVDLEVATKEGLRFTDKQIDQCAEWAAMMGLRYGWLPSRRTFRHFDIAADKPQCPDYLIRNQDQWELLLMKADKYYYKMLEDVMP